MAGGTFTSQNKVRPGAYIVFKAVTQALSKLGTRGVMTMPVAMSWGATVTELLSTDFVDDKCLAKIGYVASDAESLVFREALKNCYKAIIYRLDTGGTKATATLGNLTATAKYTGVVGNRISVSVVANDTKFDVITMVDGAQKDIQKAVSTVAGLVANEWVDFSGTGNLAATAGTALTTGADGTVSDGTYTTYLNAIKSYKWNTMAIPQDNDTAKAAVVTFIESQREEFGNKVQAVLFDATADYEGIINCVNGYATETETITPELFTAYMAGLTAGSDVYQSNTYHAIEGAIALVYPDGVTPYGDAEIIAALQAGKLVLSTRQDGVIVIEQDINSLHTFTTDKSYAFSKNRVIRTLDEIANSSKLSWETTFAGKVDNDAYGRSLFKADRINYFNLLEKANAIQEFDSATDIAVLAGEALDAVVLQVAVKCIDSMEKLYMTVNVD